MSNLREAFRLEQYKRKRAEEDKEQKLNKKSENGQYKVDVGGKNEEQDERLNLNKKQKKIAPLNLPKQNSGQAQLPEGFFDDKEAQKKAEEMLQEDNVNEEEKDGDIGENEGGVSAPKLKEVTQSLEALEKEMKQEGTLKAADDEEEEVLSAVEYDEAEQLDQYSSRLIHLVKASLGKEESKTPDQETSEGKKSAQSLRQTVLAKLKENKPVNDEEDFIPPW